MVQSWSFDELVWSFNWVPLAITLGALEWTGFFSGAESGIEELKKDPFAIGGMVVVDLLELGAFLLKHPLALVVFFPAFFRLRKPSDYRFDVKFDGIDTVKRFLPYGSKELVSRVLVKWETVTEVKKVLINNKEILSLYSLDGHIADIIWYIDTDKKRALKLLLNGMIVPKHPLRVFLESEKE
jgi:hypothetical protein